MVCSFTLTYAWQRVHRTLFYRSVYLYSRSANLSAGRSALACRVSCMACGGTLLTSGRAALDMAGKRNGHSDKLWRSGVQHSILFVTCCASLVLSDQSRQQPIALCSFSCQGLEWREHAAGLRYRWQLKVVLRVPQDGDSSVSLA